MLANELYKNILAYLLHSQCVNFMNTGTLMTQMHGYAVLSDKWS